MPRGAHQPLSLLPANARGRAAIVPLRSRPHFDEHQRAIALAHHQIDLAATARHIARHQTQALALQTDERVRFESRSDVFGPTTT